jgi:phosphoglycerate kinase
MRSIGDPDFDAWAKRALVRVDFNVPLDDRGAITDDSRIRAALPTIRALLEQQAKIVLMSHLGRPEGVDPNLSLRPVAERLQELLGRPVRFVPDCVGPAAEAAAAELAPGEVALLENLRFHPEEEANDPAFARRLARLGDLYVNDAFGAAHRAHASTEGVTHFLPSYAGCLMQREIEVLSDAMERPERPLVVILGGAKVKDKLGVIDNLLGKADAMLLGGGMAFTFIKAQGCEIGRSLLDEKRVGAAAKTLKRPEANRLKLPVDVLVASGRAHAGDERIVTVDAIPADRIGVDIGPATSRQFAEILHSAKTIVWNGPMGVFEVPEFAAGTRVVAHAVRERSHAGATVIVGGGDTVAALEQLGYAEGIGHLSTGGGASLEFLEGKALPGVQALSVGR